MATKPIPPDSTSAAHRRSRAPRQIVDRVIYLAAPVTLYCAPQYDRALRLLEDLGAGLVISARERFPNCEAWLREFPQVLSQVDALVVALGTDRVVGAGVVRELVEAVARGLPVHFLTPDGAFHRLRGARLRILSGTSLRRFARVEFPARETA